LDNKVSDAVTVIKDNGVTSNNMEGRNSLPCKDSESGNALLHEDDSYHD